MIDHNNYLTDDNLEILNVSDLIPSIYSVVGNVYSDFGMLIVKSGTLIDKRVLNKLKILNVQTVNAVKVKTTVNLNELADIQEFKTTYSNGIKNVISTFSEIINGNDLDTSDIKNSDEDIIKILKYDNDIFSYLAAIKDIDDCTYSHCTNVSIMCQVFGKFLSMNELEVEYLATAGLLHDIGKTKVNQITINKKEPLTEDERYEVMKHVMYSYRLIENMDLPECIKLGVLMHHERIDGSGYFYGLKGDRIHPFAKIIAIVDMYEAMTQPRPYRAKLMPLEVLDYIKNNTMTIFDLDLTNKFIDFVSRGFKDLQVETNRGDKGKIVLLNNDDLANPIISVDGNIIDLSKEKDIKIERIF